MEKMKCALQIIFLASKIIKNIVPLKLTNRNGRKTKCIIHIDSFSKYLSSEDIPGHFITFLHFIVYKVVSFFKELRL